MLNWFFKKNSQGAINFEYQANLVHQISKYDQKDIERLFARIFMSEEGQKALAYLQHITFYRQFSATISDEQLRHIEGQRSLVLNILRLIENGRKG